MRSGSFESGLSVSFKLLQPDPVDQQFEIFFAAVGDEKADLFDTFKVKIPDIEPAASRHLGGAPALPPPTGTSGPHESLAET